MYALMATDDKWYTKEQSETYKRITELGQKLIQHSKDNSKRVFEKERFLALQRQGLTMQEIEIELDVGRSKLYDWRKEHGLLSEAEKKNQEELSYE
ncbi:hypothetical protein C240_2236 [Enterococcus sp. 5H]|nr:hypothetical protein [Enterococcus sp. 5H]